MQHLYIITGSSRGLGLELARQLLAPDHMVIGVARKLHTGLQTHADSIRAPLQQWVTDLSACEAAARQLETALQRLPASGFVSASLINNAAVIPAITALHKVPEHELTQALRVGLEAPMVLTSVFLRATLTWPSNRRVLNISSGLGRRAMASQAAYCAVKAGLDHFTRCLALEQAGSDNPARVCSLAPGVIATQMQDQMRAAADGDFPDKQTFVSLHRSGALQSPMDAAARILAYLQGAGFGMQAVADIREV